MPSKNAGLSVGFLFDDTLDSSDGVAQHVKTLGKWLTDAGHQVSYCVGETQMSSWAGGRVYSLAKNLKVTFNGNNMSIPLLSHKTDLKRVMEEAHFDVLHVMTPYSPFMSQRLIRLAPPSTAVVGTFHIFPAGPLSRWGTRLLRPVYGQSLDRIDEMISVSQPAANFCKQVLKKQSQIIPNPLDFTAYRPVAREYKGPKRVVFLGRLVKRKGVDNLLKAFALLGDQPDVELVIAGAGPERAKLERLSHRLNIAGRTKFLGRIAESDKPGLLASAEIACFPSLYGESFGLVLVEAMAAGAKTVLGGDNPGYRSVLGEQKLSLIDPKNTDEFAARLDRLLNDQALTQKLLKWQKNTVGQYDVDSVGPLVLAVYRSAIAQRTKTSHNKSYDK